ncbi:MAG TPA: HAMP domain-containing sensor histidine kinase [Kofleriaceae bacterium]|nr:HAMP domain-containing sensor histidine kinase [Kofleriaceae bacterium]
MLDWNPTTAAGLLRARTGQVLASWEREVRGDVPELARLAPGEVRGPIAEVVERLAEWVEGRSERTSALWAVAEAHAVTRLRHGLSAAAVMREYARLRLCLHGALAELAPLTPLDHLLDLVIAHAIHHHASERDHQRERLIGMLAHDLRSPISYIAMACEALTATDHPQRQLLGQIAGTADRMQRMVTELLAFARGQLGDGVPVSPRDADFGDIVRGVLDEMRAIYRGVAITADVASGLRGAFDRDRVHQLVGNLVRNAIEHGAGAPHVAARAAHDGASIVLVVRNRGALAEGSTPRQRPAGTRGLGLYIVDQIARAHGAHVDLASNGDETAVTVHWPQRPRPEPQLQHA